MSLASIAMKHADAFKRGREREYPFVQFVKKGFFMPRNEVAFLAQKMGKDEERIEQALIGAGFKPTQIELGGNDVDGLLAEAVEIVPLRYRTIWKVNGQIVPKYQKGARGKRQLVSFIRISEGRFVGPVIITVSGKASSELFNALKKHWEAVEKLPEVKEAAKHGANAREMASLFSLLLVKGQRVRTAYNSMRTKLECEIAPTYVGDRLADAIASKYLPKAKEWAKAKPQQQAQADEAQAPEPEPEPEPQAPPVPPEPEPVPDDDFPF